MPMRSGYPSSGDLDHKRVYVSDAEWYAEIAARAGLKLPDPTYVADSDGYEQDDDDDQA